MSLIIVDLPTPDSPNCNGSKILMARTEIAVEPGKGDVPRQGYKYAYLSHFQDSSDSLSHRTL